MNSNYVNSAQCNISYKTILKVLDGGRLFASASNIAFYYYHFGRVITAMVAIKQLFYKNIIAKIYSNQFSKPMFHGFSFSFCPSETCTYGTVGKATHKLCDILLVSELTHT